MDRKLDAGALLVAASALLLVVALFLDWFGLGAGVEVSAWDVFEVLDLVLLAAAVAAVAAAFGRLDSRLLLAAALVVAVVVVSQLIQPPPAVEGADRRFGAWAALAAAAGLLAGAALVAAQIAVTVDVRGRERRRRVPAVDKRGAGAEEPKPRGVGVTEPERGAGTEAPKLSEAHRKQPVEDRFAPEPATRVVAPEVDPDATQPFAPPEGPVR